MTTQQSENGSGHALIFTFDDPKQALHVLRSVRRRQTLTLSHVIAMASVSHALDGKIVVHEPNVGNASIVKGAGIAGALDPSDDFTTFVAAEAIGGIYGAWRKHRIAGALPKAHVQELGDALPPGSSALLIVVDDAHADDVIQRLEKYDGKLIKLTLGPDDIAKLRELLAADEQ